MIPILYEKTETTFTSNGIGRLSDCVSCEVTEERNGIYECVFTYPVSGVRFTDIRDGRIVGVLHDNTGDIQPFDIYHRTEPINGIVTFYAKHISYRLNGITVKPFTASSCANALQGLVTNSIGTNPFTVQTDKTVSATYTLAVPNAFRSLLGGVDNSILDIYGKGEYKWDKFNVILNVNRGTDTDVEIRYGKNLVEFENDIDYSEAYTAVVPYWYGETLDPNDENATPVPTLVTLTEWSVDSGYSVPGGRAITVPMDLSADFNDAPTENQLRTLAQQRVAQNEAWMPTQNIKVNFVELWQTEEYKEYAPLQAVSLCDTVMVYVPMYETSVRAKVIKVTYDVLEERYKEIELGNASQSYAELMERYANSKAGALQEQLRNTYAYIDDARRYATNYITVIGS